MKCIPLLLLLALLAGASPALGQEVQPDSTRQAAWSRFQAEHGAGWEVRWNARTGLPRTLARGHTRAYTGAPETAARAFLAEHHTLLGMEPALKDLRHEKTRVNRYGLQRVTFQQDHEGVPVEGARYKVQLFEDGRVGMANGFYYPGIDLATTPSVPSARALKIGWDDLGLPATAGDSSSAELVVLPRDDGSFALVWKTILYAREPLSDWLYYVDARTGAVLERRNRLVDVTGTGHVYPTHPGRSSVTPKNLYRLTGNGRLEGTYVRVLNDDGAEAYAAGHAFAYAPSSTHFDEVMLYYHVDAFRHTFIEGLGRPAFTQITAHAHSEGAGVGDLNAWFSPTDRQIYFGDAASSPLYNDFAREDKVVYHEYAHAVVYDIESGITSGAHGEEGAISEGVADYFAGAHTGRSAILDYAAPFAKRDMASPEIASYSE